MQTFLPYPDFRKSFEVLDDKRLGKQRVEAYQIISAITGRPRKDGKPYKGWVNHPCTILWENNINALRLYYNDCIDEWVSRGFRNTMEYETIVGEFTLPEWVGNDLIHSSHRSNLLRKDYEYYSKFGWLESDDLPYVWIDREGKWYKQMVGKNIRDYLNTYGVMK